MGVFESYDQFPEVEPADVLVGLDVSDDDQSEEGSTKWATVGQLLGVAGIVFPTGTAGGDAAVIGDAVGAMPVAGDALQLSASAPWNLSAGGLAAIVRSGVYLEWAPGAYIIGSGTGDLLRMYDSTNHDTRTVIGGGILGNPLFDISAMGAGSSAVHIGDIDELLTDFRVQNTGSQANQPGIHFDCNYCQAEKIKGTVRATGVNILFDISANTSGTVTGSYERMLLDCFTDTNGICDGVTFANGAFTADHKLGLAGNFNTSTTQYAALRITGDLSGQYSGIGPGQLFTGCELDDNVHLAPYTIYLGSGSNYISGPSGNLDFSLANPFTPCNIPGGVLFFGTVRGDAAIFPYGGTGTAPLANPISGNGQTIFTVWFPLVAADPGSASYTGTILQPGGFDGQPVTVMNTGTGSITFAASGTSNVAQGTGAVIAGLSSRSFTWNASTSLWY